MGCCRDFYRLQNTSLLKYFSFFLICFYTNFFFTKEILYKEKFYKSPDDLASYLYLSRDFEDLFTITLEGINNKQNCEFRIPFVEKSIRASFQKKNKQFTEFLYQSVRDCKVNYPIEETYLKYLIEEKKFDEAIALRNKIGDKSFYFRFLEERLFINSRRLRHDQNFFVSLMQNSNVNSGFSADTVNLYGIPFEVSDESAPKKGIGVKYVYKGQSYGYLNASSQLRVNTYLSYEDYEGIESDKLTPFISSELVFNKNNMFALGLGITSFSDRTIYETQTISYMRRFHQSNIIDTLKLSLGNVRSPINEINSSIYKNLGFQKNLNNFYLNLGYTKNDTAFGFSSYKEMDFKIAKTFTFNWLNIKPFYQFKKRNYESIWSIYGKRRTFVQNYLGLEFFNKDKLGLTISKSNNSSNIPIYDNDVDMVELRFNIDI